MNRLVIDDLRTFDFEATYARSSAAALEILMDPEWPMWDEIYFDHDLGVTEDGKLDDIWPVINWLEWCHHDGQVGYDQFITPPSFRAFVVSSNPGGAARIEMALNGLGYQVGRMKNVRAHVVKMEEW